MDKLTQQHYDAIKKCTDQEDRETMVEQAEACAQITRQEMKEFAEWKDENEWQKFKGSDGNSIWFSEIYPQEQYRGITTDQLIEQFEKQSLSKPDDKTNDFMQFLKEDSY